ncbi:hypothetical protein [Kitasatospora kifunensis]|uniref:Uncharacterized protein n=1 Tax=Kitasatospora kifunensis TaxID=58351 RepID=A0A7W7QXT4_KITKI|nr:hypothetical protein [Kitasatospora kifunensis]MBB4921757.1 hypothetical protein [Kitasatospora kifunensis]
MISLRIRAAFYAVALALLTVPTPAQARPIDAARPAGVRPASTSDLRCQQHHRTLKAASEGPPCRTPQPTRPHSVA